MNHSFNIEFAEKYGIEEAIIIQHLDFWLSHNKANNANYYDDEYWTYNSAKAFSKLFTYMSAAKIRRVLISLEEKEIIKTGNYNSIGYDRTKWYTFTEQFCKMNKCNLQFCKMDSTKSSNGIYKNVEPIPDINTDVKPIINNIGVDEKHINEFEQFWESYPKKADKKRCKDKYMKLKKSNTLPSLSEHLKIIEKWKLTQKWKAGYIPNPLTWLNGERWEDEIQADTIMQFQPKAEPTYEHLKTTPKRYDFK